MKSLSLPLLALLLSGVALAAAADRPNVIFLLADDQGSADLGSYGAVTH